MNVLDDNDSDISEGAPVKLGVDPKIDWFHFETRMRSLIQEMLEPTMRRSVEDNAEMKYVKKLYDELNEKFQDFEFRVGMFYYQEFLFTLFLLLKSLNYLKTIEFNFYKL